MPSPLRSRGKETRERGREKKANGAKEKKRRKKGKERGIRTYTRVWNSVGGGGSGDGGWNV